MQHLTKEAKTLVAAAAASAAQTAVTSSTIDRQGFEAARFVAVLGDVTDTCVLTLKVQQGDDSGGSDATDITGASATFTAGAASADLKALAVDVVKPTKRYLTAVLTRTTANAVVNTILCDLYHARNTPVAAGDVVATALKVVA